MVTFCPVDERESFRVTFGAVSFGRRRPGTPAAAGTGVNRCGEDGIAMSLRAFTVEEANELIPHLEGIVREIQEARERARDHYEKLQILDALWGEEVTEEENPDHGEYRQRRREISRATRRIKATVETEIRARGVRFPVGGLEYGLLDFPTTYDGRWVFLCWHRGEPEVGYWHEVDLGYRGRRRITDEQARVMGREDDPGELADPGWEL